jgi:methylated-DNA-[protein]-cysteine S-methyltransferase
MPLATAFYDTIESPLGPLFIGGSERGFHRFHFLTDDLHASADLAARLDASVARLAEETGLTVEHDPARAEAAAMQFREYFAGTRTAFDLRLSPHGSEFQRRVWDALYEIPAGHTRTYGEIARRIGQPSASRAVGMANHHNPLVIVVPCHRVVGADGTLTGYGGGLDRKRWLLEHETSSLPLFASIP